MLLVPTAGAGGLLGQSGVADPMAQDLAKTFAGAGVTAYRTELRPLLPAPEAAFVAQLYGLDPVAEAARVKAPTMIVVPADPAPYDPERLAAAIAGARVVNSVGTGSTLVDSGPTPEDLSDPTSANHELGAGAPVARTARDTAALDRVARFVASNTR